jgi:hypothetical protein
VLVRNKFLLLPSTKQKEAVLLPEKLLMLILLTVAITLGVVSIGMTTVIETVLLLLPLLGYGKIVLVQNMTLVLPLPVVLKMV